MHKHTCTESHTAAWTNTLIYSLHTHTRTRTHWEEEITLNLVSGGVNAAGSNRVMKLFERWDEVQPFPLLSVSALMCWWLTGVRDEGGGGRRGGGRWCVCGGISWTMGPGHKAPFVASGTLPPWKSLMQPAFTVTRFPQRPADSRQRRFGLVTLQNHNYFHFVGLKPGEKIIVCLIWEYKCIT